MEVDFAGWKAELALGAGWLNTEMNARHRELNPDTVTRRSTNRPDVD